MFPKLIAFSAALFCTSLFAQAQRQPVTPQQPKNLLQTQLPNYTYKILGGNGLYGYDVLKDSTVILHQPATQASNNRLNLKTAIQATRAANFVIYKLQHNIQPASLTPEEMKKVTIDQ